MRYGALIGDIAGSRFEGVPNDFFQPECASPLKEKKPYEQWYSSSNTDYSGLVLKGRFTDDSVLTLAVADAILLHKETNQLLEPLVVQQLQEKGRLYASRGFGSSFYNWMFHSKPAPYGSYGNGAAMRVSPCAWLAESREQALEYARIVTNVTHNHPDSLWGAEFVTDVIYTFRTESKEKDVLLGELCKKYEIDLDTIQNEEFQINCKKAALLAFKAFAESNSFNETIHKVINYGGDTDTLAAIAGSMAEACYQIDKDLIAQAEKFFGEEGISPYWEEPVANACFKAFKEWKES